MPLKKKKRTLESSVAETQVEKNIVEVNSSHTELSQVCHECLFLSTSVQFETFEINVSNRDNKQRARIT